MKKLSLLSLILLLSVFTSACVFGADSDTTEPYPVLPRETRAITDETSTDNSESSNEHFERITLYGTLTQNDADGDIRIVCTNIGMTMYLDESPDETYSVVDFPDPISDLQYLENSFSLGDIDGDGYSDISFEYTENEADRYTFLWDNGIDEFIYCENIADLYVK